MSLPVVVYKMSKAISDIVVVKEASGNIDQMMALKMLDVGTHLS
jgi:dihydrodipicolinate synthase/N-acetylneuraminate lyase